MKTTYIVLIQEQDADGLTSGTYKSETEPKEGETITITAKDENGNPIEKTGRLVEIAEIAGY